jgi:hypothetical protein
MDPTTASYYRAILFSDSQDARPLPKSLIDLHAWAFKRSQALGIGGIISKASALSIAMTWMSSTSEGREFTRDCTTLGEMFCQPNAAPVVSVVPTVSPVSGEKPKQSRPNPVQLAGV